MSLRPHIESALRALERDEQREATASLLAALEEVDLAIADLLRDRRRRDAEEAARTHRFDREISAAEWRRRRAESGRGYKFELPPSLRRTA